MQNQCTKGQQYVRKRDDTVPAEVPFFGLLEEYFILVARHYFNSPQIH